MTDPLPTFIAQGDLDELTRAIADSRLDLWDYTTSAGILIGSIAAGRLVRVAIRRLIGRSRADNLLGDLIGRLVSYLVIVFGLVYALDKLGIAVGPILGALGIAGIALAFAFQDILENFVAGVILQIQRPFASGDEILVSDHEGRIVEVDARTITIETPDGETVRIPSADVIKNPIVNHTRHGRRRTTVDVGVAYDTDLDRAAEVLLAAVRDVDGVLTSPAPQALVHTFGASSIDLAVRYWHRPSIAEMWLVRDRVTRAIAVAFDANGITIPFPQRVVHLPVGSVVDGDQA